MKRIFALSIFLIFTASLAIAKGPENYYVKITTSQGEGILKLYNETPLHRDNFLMLVREGYYDGLLFHRVIEHFMIQGGDPNSKGAASGVRLGSGGPDYRVDAEFRPHLFHKKGALAAARDNNPEKASSASQFYLVQGRTYSDAGLDSLQTMRMNGRVIPADHREVYKTLGGVPHLDQGYTVYGELIIGLDLIDKIASVETDRNDRPETDQTMSMDLLTRRESINVERGLAGLKPKNSVFSKFFDLFKPKYITLD